MRKIIENPFLSKNWQILETSSNQRWKQLRSGTRRKELIPLNSFLGLLRVHVFLKNNQNQSTSKIQLNSEVAATWAFRASVHQSNHLVNALWYRANKQMYNTRTTIKIFLYGRWSYLHLINLILHTRETRAYPIWQYIWISHAGSVYTR